MVILQIESAFLLMGASESYGSIPDKSASCGLEQLSKIRQRMGFRFIWLCLVLDLDLQMGGVPLGFP